ncbi:hypothetical protein [Thioalkalivibrio nitratireducens]|nr:hypothetical protein [Thioalkalivibrio nitratireducens]
MYRPQPRTDQRATLTMLFALTGLVLTLQHPDALEAPAQLVSKLDFPTPAHVMELRPESPPPWMDGDQMMADEAEDLPAIATVGRETPPADLRERPQR